MKYLKILFIILILQNYIYSQEATIIVPGEKQSNTMIQSRQIDENGYIESGEAIKDIEGVHIIRRGESSLDLNIRGFSKDNINVLPDGEKIYGACPNRMDAPSNFIILDSIQSIEVIKGPYDVKNEGGMGASVYTKPKEIKEGLENYIKLQSGSYNEQLTSFRSSYGTKNFKISVSGGYQSYQPYRDGNGNSITRVYPDYDHIFYWLPLPDSINIAGNNYSLADFKYQFPYVFPELYTDSVPSTNRYEYNNRNILTYKKNAQIRTIFSPNKKHELEIKANYSTLSNGLTPYLKMDTIWDEMKGGSIRYSLKDISSQIHKISFRIYGNEVIHDMSDSLRCSSYSDSTGCITNTLSRDYGMRSWATSSTKGIKIESELKLLGKTIAGVDTYIRKWNVDTTTRMPYPMTLYQQIPSMMTMSSMSMGMSGMVLTNYRTQASIPDTITQNTGIYIENENSLSRKLEQKIGFRYDIHSTKAQKDRRIAYNIYYPAYEPIFQYQYVSLTKAFTVWDAEIYLPQKNPQKKYGEGSGFIQWKYHITKDVKTKLGLGYGVRFPDPQELFFALIRMGTPTSPDYIGNPNLKPSRNKEIDLGISLKKENINLEFDTFYSNVENYIIIRNTPDIYFDISRDQILYLYPVNSTTLSEYINQLISTYSGISTQSRYARTYKPVHAILYGGEANLKYQLSEHYLIQSGISYTRGINQTEKMELQEIPPFNGSIAFRYIQEAWFVELEGEFADTQSRVDKNIGEKRTPGWGIANLKFGYEILTKTKNSIRIHAGIRNLFNRYYTLHLSYLREPFATGIRIPEYGRNIYANIEIKF